MSTFPFRFRERKGFTLIELLVVVFILGIISFVVYPSIGSIKDRTAFSQCQGQRSMIETAKASYVSDNMGMVPSSFDLASTDSTIAAEAANGRLVLISYFPEGLKQSGGISDFGVFVCPRDPALTVYSNVYSFYEKVTCPYCVSNPVR